MATRSYNFVSGVETSTLPTVTDPTVDADIISLGYANTNFQKNTVTGTYASPQLVVAGTGIVADNDAPLQTIFVQGSGGPVDVSANPQITAPTVNGAELILFGTDDTNYVLLEDGNGLKLNGPVYLDSTGSLTLVAENVGVSARWREKCATRTR